MATDSTNSSSIANNCLISPDFDQNHITNLPDSLRTTWIFLAVVNGIAAPPTVLINLLIIWTILEDEHLRSVTYNFFLVALAVTDLLVGLVVVPLFLWWLACLLQECSSTCRQFTAYFSSSLLCCALTTPCTLMMTSMERYLAIEHPLFYTTTITNKKLMIAAAIVWVFIAPAPLLGLLLSNKVPCFVFVILELFVIFFCTTKVHLTAHRQRRAIAARTAAVKQTNKKEEQVEQAIEQQNRLQLEYKRTFAMGMLVIASVLFYGPCLTTIIIQTAKGKDVTDDFKYGAQPISATFVHLQSLINPLIISLRLSYIRQGVKNKLLFRF